MEIVKVEMDAVQSAVTEANEMINELQDLQLAIVGGGTTDVTFC